MLSVNKLFAKAEKAIPEDKVIFKTDFHKSSNHKMVTLLLTSDDQLFKINRNKTYYCKLDQEVRFSIKCEQGNTQTVKQMRGDDHNHSQVYKFGLEKDDTNVVEFYNFNFCTMYWFDHLRARMHMLDYHIYYDVSKLIGKGSFACVYEAKSKNDGQMFAAKAILKKMAFQHPKGREQVENEIQIMRHMNHPNLINLQDVFENKAQIYIIMDLARGGSLEYSLKVLNAPVPFLSAKVIFRQIVEGVAYMHENNIMHRDLKPGNILFREFVPLKKYGLVHLEANVLLSDFGISSKIQENMSVYKYCGSPGYMAPEVFETENDDTKTYNEKCDIFSLGCILYQLLTGKMLFSGATSALIKQANVEMKLNWVQIETELNGSHSLTVMLQRMLSPNPAERPCCKELLDSKILEVEYGNDGVPVFKDFNRPKSSPPKRQFQEEQPQRQKRNSVLHPKTIKFMPIINEKSEKTDKVEKRDSNKEIRNHHKRSTQIDQFEQAQQQQVSQTPNANAVRAQRRSSALSYSSGGTANNIGQINTKK